MSTQNSGYVLDLPYTWSFFNFQSPVLLSYVARINGLRPPPVDKPFRYCELGCGNGVTTNLLASALPHGEFYGVDFNPDHIANAKRLAGAGGLTNVHYIENSFADLLNADIAQFDYMSLHGVYSWVSRSIRAEILQLIDRFLKPGGLLYLSYNALPGWTNLLPLWKMMYDFTARLDEDSISKARAGLEYLRFLRDKKASYFRKNPAAGKYLDRMLKRDIAYVAHEFCNEYFEPQYFCDVAKDMSDVGLAYVGSAKIINNHTAQVIPDRFLGFLEQYEDRTERESHQSFMVNDFFRRDVFRKEAEIEKGTDDIEILADTIVALNVEPADVERKVDIGRDGFDYSGPFFDNLIAFVTPGDKTVRDVLALTRECGYDDGIVIRSLHALIAGGQFQPIAKCTDVADVISFDRLRICDEINRALLNERLLEDGKCYVGSNVLGSAIRLNLIRGLCLLAYHNVGATGAVEYIESRLNESEQWPRKLRSAEVAKREQWIKDELADFETGWVPRLLRFGIVEAVH